MVNINIRMLLKVDKGVTSPLKVFSSQKDGIYHICLKA